MELVRRPLPARVTAVTRLTRQLVRVTVTAPELNRFDYAGPDHLVRIFLPPAPGADLVLPKTDRWWPELQELDPAIRPILRNYTVRAFDPTARRLGIDFVLHGTGPGSAFAASAQPGDVLGILSDGADYRPPDDTEWQLLVGDETALPAIAAIIEQLRPDERALAFVEVGDRDDELAIPRHPGVRLHWLHRGDTPPGGGDLLLRRLRQTALPTGRAYAWVAGESSLVTSVRRHLVAERGLEKLQIYFCGYWRRMESPA
ncbi:NADPH-dependent ferric siderophore reductase [Kribbella amoyensis]|uniref:NADPH-dependent ferric siderophore reductase n=1 Tax=Kribbella amoyensis TaxID=996641 RepID=A0A561BTI3_9ACTN|nr:siderophore-interacting protein [Kribbella amoyensis]TWD82122.1 NADPH-dependent ferric siderophore reductase [Kribbella amoyensis]